MSSKLPPDICAGNATTIVRFGQPSRKLLRLDSRGSTTRVSGDRSIETIVSQEQSLDSSQVQAMYFLYISFMRIESGSVAAPRLA